MALSAPSGFKGLTDRLLRIDLWVIGVVFYLLGTMRLISHAAAQTEPPPRQP